MLEQPLIFESTGHFWKKINKTETHLFRKYIESIFVLQDVLQYIIFNPGNFSLSFLTQANFSISFLTLATSVYHFLTRELQYIIFNQASSVYHF